MLRIFILALIALLFPLSSFADFYKSVQESGGEYILTLQVNAKSLKFNNTYKNFTQVELPDAQAIGAVGNPALPVISRFFDVKGTNYTATIEMSNPVHFSGVKISPIQPDHKENARQAPFVYNAAAYAKDQNPSVIVGELVSIGNGKALAVRVNPFARHGDQLILFQTMKIHLKSTANVKPIVTEKSGLGSHSLFHYDQQNLLISHPTVKENINTPKEFGVVMVLTSKALLKDAKNYAALHPKYKMELVTIKNGAKFLDVKKMIADRYAIGNLDTVVLYGDEKQVPGANWEFYNSDSFYQYLNETQPTYTQIAIGRIPAQNTTDAKFYNDKLAAYLKNKKTYFSKNVMLIAHNEEYPEKYTANQEAIRNAPNPMGFVYNTQYGGADSTNASVLLEAPKHYPLINYRDHGDEGSWWSWDKNYDSFNSEQISLLQNIDENVSVFFNIACLTGAFQSPKRNMSENLIFLANKGTSYRGAISVLGATAPSYTDINNRFDIHLFELMEMQKDLPLGHLIALANDKLVLEDGGQMNDNIKMYVLFGDPLLSVW